jgi:hypothetical protein
MQMTFLQFKTEYHYILATTITLCFVLDIFTACTLCFYLAKNKSGFKESVSPVWQRIYSLTSSRSDRLINRLMKLSVETGLLASSFDLVMLITVRGHFL